MAGAEIVPNIDPLRLEIQDLVQKCDWVIKAADSAIPHHFNYNQPDGHVHHIGADSAAEFRLVLQESFGEDYPDLFDNGTTEQAIVI